MSLKKIAMLLALALTGAAVFAGCGGDDDGGSESEALTKTELIAQADEICQAATDEVEEATADFDENTADDELVQFTEDTYVPLLQDEVSDLQALTPPEEEADAYEAMLSSLEDGVDQIESDPELVLGNENPLADATEKAEAIGFEVCGQG